MKIAGDVGDQAAADVNVLRDGGMRRAAGALHAGKGELALRVVVNLISHGDSPCCV